MTRAMHYLQAGTVVLLLAAIPAAGENTGTQPDRDGADLLTAHPLLLGAHRCGRHEWPENTLVAVREAAKRWPEALLEVDAQLSSDGQVVLMHDFDVDRTTDGTGYLGSKTLAELQTLDAAYHFTQDGGNTFPYRGSGVRIPTLKEALAAAPDHRFFIEMKDGTDIGRATAEVILEAGAAHRCIVASVSPLFLEAFRTHAPGVATAYDFISAADMLAALRGGDWKAHQPAHRLLALSPKLKQQFDMTDEELDRIRQKGILVSFFTLNTPEEMREAMDLGVDNILTDCPSLLATIIKERGAHCDTGNGPPEQVR